MRSMVDRNSPTHELEEAVEEFYKDFPYPPYIDFGGEFSLDFEDHCARKFKKVPPEPLSNAIGIAVALIYASEAPDLAFERETHAEPIAHARYRDYLHGILNFKDKPHASRLQEFRALLTAVFEPLVA